MTMPDTLHPPGAEAPASREARRAGPSAAVLVCTYRRPADLLRCLGALAIQTRKPDEVIIVVRDTDHETRDALQARPPEERPLRLVSVAEPGLVPARNAGLAACRSDILAMVDDDTAPHPDWLARVVAHFAGDPALGGLGGRDRCHDGNGLIRGDKPVVGRLQWFGRMIGNHHLGIGPPRQVDMLKGANMSFRAAAIGTTRFDLRLRGRGAMPYEDIAFSMAVRRKGWRLLYDPEVVVEHFSGPREEPRHYGGVLPLTDVEGFRDYAFNGVVARWEELSPLRHLAFAAFSVLVGTGVCPGLAQAVRYTPSMGLESWRRWIIATQGLLAGYREMLRGDRSATTR